MTNRERKHPGKLRFDQRKGDSAMDLEIHYLSATAVITEQGNRHLSFCNQLFDYERDRERYQVANYSMPTRVDCYPCLDAYSKTYPQRWAGYLESAATQAGVNPWRETRWPAPATYPSPESEPAIVSAYRANLAQLEREWLARYINDETVPTVDLMAAFSQISYGNARRLARLAIRAHEAANGPITGPTSDDSKEG